MKCEEIQEIGTPIMAGTADNFKVLNLPKSVELNSPSIHGKFVKVTINYSMLSAIVSLNRC